MTIVFEELLSPDSRLFAKSEFGPANADWPALSFSSNKIAAGFQAIARRGRDFVIYVGTSNADDTPNPNHRQRLVSVVDVEPRAIVRTKEIVAPIAWTRAQEMYPGRWDVSLRLARAWDVQGFPRAHDMLPLTYAKFQNPGTRGHPIPAEQGDYARLRSLVLVPVDLATTSRAADVLNLNVDDAQLRKELSRLANSIQKDIERSLKQRDGKYPFRTAPNYSDVFAALSNAWREQQGRCPLCDREIPLTSSNKLLQMSRDRIDSANKEYSGINTHLTHLGCNLAKSDATMEEWLEFRAMLVGAQRR